jgi:hypothetical protein
MRRGGERRFRLTGNRDLDGDNGHTCPTNMRGDVELPGGVEEGGGTGEGEGGVR